MKRYLIFAGNHYYPDGGMYDFIFDCEEINHIGINLITRYEKDFNSYDRWQESVEEFIKDEIDWLQVYDTKERKIIKNNILNEL